MNEEKQMYMEKIMKEVIPSRPSLSKEIIEQAVNKVISENKSIFHDIDDYGIEDIVEKYHYGMDGYEIAKKLDDNGWEMNLEIANALDEIGYNVKSILSELEWEWQKEYNIQQQFEIGTKIKEGVISGISQYHAACYEVRHNENPNSFKIIKFENAIPV